MAITVRSPYTGRQVKIREEDVGRAVRDDAGHFFYVLPTADGSGHYGARTRAGSEQEQEQALQLEASPPPEPDQPATHDARGKGRPLAPGRLVLVVVLVLIAAGALLLTVGPLGNLAKLRLDGLSALERPAPEIDESSLAQGPEGLRWHDTAPGTGAVAEPGDTVHVRYVAWARHAEKAFDATTGEFNKKPIVFEVGRGQVIRGLDLGVTGMRVGQQRLLVIPPDLAEGLSFVDQREVQPDATILFEIELLDVK